MTDIFEKIGKEFEEINSRVPKLIYYLFIEHETKIHTSILKNYGELFEGYILELDKLDNIDKNQRKQAIVCIQNAQKIIDKAIQKNDKIVDSEMPVSELKQLNEKIIKKTAEIEHLKSEIGRLRFENSELKRTICTIHTQTNEFVEFTDF